MLMLLHGTLTLSTRSHAAPPAFAACIGTRAFKAVRSAAHVETASVPAAFAASTTAARSRWHRPWYLLRPHAGAELLYPSVRRLCSPPAARADEAEDQLGEESCQGWEDATWEKQLNIRDLEKGNESPQQLFRTSCVFAPNKPRDLVEQLIAQRNISVVLDLRSLDEMKTDVDSSFETVVFSRTDPPSLTAAVAAAEEGKLVRYVVPLLERDFILPSLRKRLPLGRRAAFIWAGLTNSRREQELMVEEINKVGLGGLNELMLDAARVEICWALQLLASLRAVPQSAVAIQCRLGKDRTGLISALVKAILGETEAEIIADYKLSEGIDEIALGELQQRLEKAAAPGKPVLDRKIFSGADPANMVTTLAWLKRSHGSVEGYLDTIGFDAEWRRRLRGLEGPGAAPDDTFSP